MRRFLWAIVLLLGSAGLASAQVTSFLRPVNPNSITFTPIDTSNAIVSPSLPTAPGRFTMSNFLSKFSMTSLFSKPVVGRSPFPAPSSFPSTHYKSPIQPQMPIMGGH